MSPVSEEDCSMCRFDQGKIRKKSFLTAETRSSQRRYLFFSGGERPPEKKPSAEKSSLRPHFISVGCG